MSEGFADMSASLYVSMIEKNPKKFIDFWNDERQLLLEKNAQGFRAIDVGAGTGLREYHHRTENPAARPEGGPKACPPELQR
jgi:hypothetical protein